VFSQGASVGSIHCLFQRCCVPLSLIKTPDPPIKPLQVLCTPADHPIAEFWISLQ